MNDILFVLEISTNLLYIYHILHFGNGKTIEFFHDDATIQELENLDINVPS